MENKSTEPVTITVAQMKDAKEQLEAEIARLLKSFSDKTGLTVDRITITSGWRSMSSNDSPPELYLVGVEARL